MDGGVIEGVIRGFDTAVCELDGIVAEVHDRWVFRLDIEGADEVPIPSEVRVGSSAEDCR